MYPIRPNTKWLKPLGLGCVIFVCGVLYVCRNLLWEQRFEITDELGGNIFPSAILATAATNAEIMSPADSNYVGKPLSGIALRVKSPHSNSRVRVTLKESPFFAESISEFMLEKSGVEYTIYPEIVWDYEALKNNVQSTPMTFSVTMEINGKKLPVETKTLSVRSINECLLGYLDSKNKFHDTGVFFAAYVNEENPKIDQLLREALNTRIVKRFLGYQASAEQVDKQVYALWHVLQKRNFKYSSMSNVVFAQRVRTFDDALEAAQINCVDGSVLFASLLKAININPILVRLPGHMFVGYYTDKSHKDMNFLETTMIGDVDLEDFFPDEKLDSTMVGKSQEEMSRLTFDRSKQYATNKYHENEENLRLKEPNYMFLEISKETRSKIQSIGK